MLGRMWRVAIVLVLGCTEPVTYQVTTQLPTSGTARLVFDDRLYTMHTESYEVSDYDELRDVAQTATIRSNGADIGVVLPFAASECGSEQWIHTGELVRIEVGYYIYPNGATFIAYAQDLRCIDSNGEMHVR